MQLYCLKTANDKEDDRCKQSNVIERKIEIRPKISTQSAKQGI